MNLIKAYAMDAGFHRKGLPKGGFRISKTAGEQPQSWRQRKTIGKIVEENEHYPLFSGELTSRSFEKELIMCK